MNDNISEDHISYIHKLCRLAHGMESTSDATLKIEHLTDFHLPPGPGAEASVTIVSIGTLKHVNRLPSDQTLSFGPGPGLTVIYGENGTGKSGFARVIKKSCRTRGALPDIKPNIFTASATNPATAHIEFRVADTDHQFTWIDGQPSDRRLGNIFVFDTFSASTYLSSDGPTAFTPRGLDILPKLSKLCDLIGKLIQSEIDIVELKIAAAMSSWAYPQESEVAALILALSKNTTASQIDSLAGLNTEETSRLAAINSALSSDAKQKAKAARAGAVRLRAYSAKTAKAVTNISDQVAENLKALINNEATTTAAAAAFSNNKFDSDYLAGTGSDTWKHLWNSAREFAINGPYKGFEFPYMGDDAQCVLCQQPVDSTTARNRMEYFDAFCKDQSQKLAEQATKQLNSALTSINLVAPILPEFISIEADLSQMANGDFQLTKDFISLHDARLATLKANLAMKTWNAPVPLPVFPAAAVTRLADKHDELAALEESADDPTLRQQLTQERDNLIAKQWLASVKPAVLEQIDRHKQLASLKRCKKDTATKSITDKNTELSTQLITEAFCQRFAEEVKHLGLQTISVKMEDASGRKGERRFGPRIVDAADHDLNQVASEGEQRCIALAAFLAELSLASHNSALVFDDPVSSLDHGHRERIAMRLVAESKIRQVIVFTHDPVLVHGLEFYSVKQDSSIAFRHLEWGHENPGRCNHGLPWDFKSVKDRIDKLEKIQRDIKSKWQPIPSESNVSEMRHAYSLLRASLERIVERELLGNIVFRFRSYIDLKDLTRIIGVTKEECDEISRLFKAFCEVIDAHDYSVARLSRVPDPSELELDIRDLQKISETVHLRQKNYKLSHK